MYGNRDLRKYWTFWEYWNQLKSILNCILTNHTFPVFCWTIKSNYFAYLKLVTLPQTQFNNYQFLLVQMKKLFKHQVLGFKYFREIDHFIRKIGIHNMEPVDVFKFILYNSLIRFIEYLQANVCYILLLVQCYGIFWTTNNDWTK